MDQPRFTDLDDDLFPACDAQRLGTTHTDEFGVTYICDLVDELGYAWVQLARPEPRTDPRAG